MKKVLVMLMLFHYASFGDNEIADSRLDTNIIRIGEQLYFYISCSTKDTNIVWPVFDNNLTKGVEILEESKIDTITSVDNELVLYSQKFLITAWDSGLYHIPEIIFNEKIKTQSLSLQVKTISIEEGAIEKDIKEPFQEPYGWRDVLPYILVLLILACIFYILQKYIWRKKPNKVEEQVEIPYHITAIKSLQNLEKENLWQKGEIKQYHSRISEILRIYIEKRYRFIAMELPTGDILYNLKKNSVEKNIIKEIGVVLQRADLAKFAKSNPTNIENEESMKLAQDSVRKTKL